MAIEPTAFLSIFPSSDSLVSKIGVMVGDNIGLFLAILVGILILKGFALWFSSRSNKKLWFWILLITNTLGILPAIYLIFFRKK